MCPKYFFSESFAWNRKADQSQGSCKKKIVTPPRKGDVVEIRKSYLEMIKAFPGGWDAMVGALLMSRDALENRIYERKGQGLLVETALQLQKFSGTTLFAEAIAAHSGGTFVKLPDIEVHNDDLMKKFNVLYAELGTFSANFNEAIEDDQIDKREEVLLRADAARVHKVLAELLALSLRVFAVPASEAA